MIYILPHGSIQGPVITLVRGMSDIAPSLVVSTHVCPVQEKDFTVFVEASVLLYSSVIGASL